LKSVFKMRIRCSSKW